MNLVFFARLHRAVYGALLATLLISSPLSADDDRPFTDARGSLSGSWYDTSRDGEGFVFEFGMNPSAPAATVFWFTHLDGEPYWLIGITEYDGDLFDQSGLLEFELLEVSGTGFGEAFEANAIKLFDRGVLSIVFDSCNQASASWVPPENSDLLGSDTLAYALQRITLGLDGLECAWTGPAGDEPVKGEPGKDGFYLASNGITVMCPSAEVGSTGVVNGITYTKRTRQEINSDNAETTCTSGILSMAELFRNNLSFNGDISSWDTSMVTNMRRMFEGALSFNQDISSWDTSSVTDMTRMFQEALSFNQDIGDWDTTAVRIMNRMFFQASSFNKNIGGWQTSQVQDMDYMFGGASVFNQDIGDWDTGSLTTMAGIFNAATLFNQDLGRWNTQHVVDMSFSFRGASSFNQDIGNWDTGSVVDFSFMFGSASSFNHPIGRWDTSSAVRMNSMFNGAAAFNQDLSSWCVQRFSLPPTGFDAGANNWILPKPNWGAPCN